MRPKDLTYLESVSEIDWARLAAYIDGEGCIRINTNHGANGTSRRVFYAEVLVANTDFRLLQWMKLTFGGSIHGTSMAKRHKPCGIWCVGARHAATIVAKCHSYFIIKREQADILLAFQATILPNRPYGMKGRPQELVDHQASLARQLSDLKGASPLRRRGRRPTEAATETIQ